ncbi:MAG TPA: adenylate kinase [Microscillaceae bacterium]|nr:adenylate kinase [Microscillaceae bacterium]
MNIIIITGPPYSGKGTQCEFLKENYQLTHVSTGDVIRKEKDNKTDIGRLMSEYADKGELVPDEVMKNLFGKVIDENLNKAGIILDGYPRTKPQVDTLLELAQEKNTPITHVLNIEVPTEELLKRAKKRAETSTREDDKNPETHIKRINVFEESTKPAIEYLKSKVSVFDINGLGEIAEITNKISDRLKDLN